MADDEHAVFEIECGKGTYVRSLARDIGRDLGCFGHVESLRRVEVGAVRAEDLVALATLEAALPAAAAGAEPMPPTAIARWTRCWSTTAAALECLPQVAPSRRRGGAASGSAIPSSSAAATRPIEAEEACATARGKLVAIGAIEAGMFNPKRVFAG